MLPQNPLLLGSTSEIKIYFSKDVDNSMNNKNAKNISDTDENSLNCHKSADAAVSAIESDLIKFSTTNISGAENKDIECKVASVSKCDSGEILKTGDPKNSIDETRTYEVSEVSTQELPVVILPVTASDDSENSIQQSTTELNEEMSSSDINIPLCIKK